MLNKEGDKNEKKSTSPPSVVQGGQKKMIDRDMNVTELAELIGVNRSYVSGIVNGRVVAPEIAKKISKALDISEKTPSVV